jgi:uncharacterized protein YfiM (DUF2279 family)
MRTKKRFAKKMTGLNKLNRQPVMLRNTLLIVAFSILSCRTTSAQTDSTLTDRKKLKTLVFASGAAYTAGIAALNHMWYKNTERQSFRFFNDNAEWKQVDKAGHFFAAFHLSDLSSRAYKSCNIRDAKANLLGAFTGLLLTLPVEVMDGFSNGYGASAGDVLADAAGPAFFFAQQLAWKEVRIYPKFSFHRTPYAPMRPSLLGDNLLSEIVKDYNGQTYWLSLDADKFTSFPKWLNFAFGYGAEDMVYARDGQNAASGFHPFRRYYLAVDFDLTAIRTRSKLVRSLLYVANSIRLPGPALQLSSRGSRFYPFYF